VQCNLNQSIGQSVGQSVGWSVGQSISSSVREADYKIRVMQSRALVILTYHWHSLLPFTSRILLEVLIRTGQSFLFLVPALQERIQLSEILLSSQPHNNLDDSPN